MLLRGGPPALEVGVHHHVHQAGEIHLGPPAEPGAGLGAVAEQVLDLIDDLAEAYQMAVWDAEEYEKGEWVRVDDGSYPVDCLDSAEYSMYGFKRHLLQGA